MSTRILLAEDEQLEARKRAEREKGLLEAKRQWEEAKRRREETKRQWEDMQ